MIDEEATRHFRFSLDSPTCEGESGILHWTTGTAICSTINAVVQTHGEDKRWANRCPCGPLVFDCIPCFLVKGYVARFVEEVVELGIRFVKC